MPWSQMISTNCMPPRAIDTSRPARLPKAKARIRNRLSWNIGSAMRVSMIPNTTSRATPPVRPASTPGVGPPPGGAAVGLDAVGHGDQHRAETHREGDVAPPVDPGRVPLAVVPQPQVGPDRAVDADRHVDPEHPPPVDRGQQPARHQP